MFYFIVAICRSHFALMRVAFISSILFAFIGFFSISISAAPLEKSTESFLGDDSEAVPKERKWYFERKNAVDPAASWRAKGLQEHGTQEALWEELAKGQAHVFSIHGEVQFPCFHDVCTCGKQYCNTEKYQRRCNWFSSSYTFKDHLKTSKGRDLIEEEFCIKKEGFPESIDDNGGGTGRVDNKESAEDALNGSCMAGVIMVRFDPSVKGILSGSFTFPFISTPLRMRDKSDGSNEYVYDLFLTGGGFEGEGDRDSIGRKLKANFIKLIADGIRNLKTAGLGSENMVLVLSSTRNALGMYKMRLSGQISVPLNYKNKKIDFDGSADYFFLQGRSNHNIWIGGEERTFTYEFRANKKSRYAQKEDEDLFARITKVEVQDIGRNLCTARDLAIVENDNLVGLNKEKRYMCGVDICKCGMSACDENVENVYGGARCEWRVDFVNQQLKDTSSRDYKACISTRGSELGEGLTTTTP